MVTSFNLEMRGLYFDPQLRLVSFKREIQSRSTSFHKEVMASLVQRGLNFVQHVKDFVNLRSAVYSV